MYGNEYMEANGFRFDIITVCAVNCLFSNVQMFDTLC